MTGNGLEAARKILAESNNPIHVETDLERAVDRALAAAGAPAAGAPVGEAPAGEAAHV
jgi:succinyl-CoA synthetase beta subunit